MCKKCVIDIDEEIKKMDVFYAKLAQDKKAANEFFYRTGFYTKKGELRKKFRK